MSCVAVSCFIHVLYGICAGLLHMKEPNVANKTHRYSFTTTKSRQNLRLFKLRKHEVNPTHKIIEDLHKELELVYVGEVCLCWEILYWQYRKVIQLQEYDIREFRQYNQVAEEYQVFQVLLQRFVENEPFQSLPRVLNYVNNRSSNCNFLHVPVVRGDNSSPSGRIVGLWIHMLTEMV